MKVSFILSTLIAVCAGISTLAQAQDFPNKTVTIVVASAPGGPLDLGARLIARVMQQRLNTPVVVENRPGAGGLIGAERIANAAPNGYTLGYIQPVVVAPFFYRNPRLDPLKAFDVIAVGSTSPLVMTINSELPAKNLAEFIEYAKAHKDKLNYAEVTPLLSIPMGMFGQATGAKLVKIGYKGNAEATRALLANEVHLAIGSIGSAAQLVSAGKLLPLAVLSDQRLAGFPAIPTMAERGPNLKFQITYALVAPAGTPRAVIAALEPSVREAIASPEFEKLTRESGGNTLRVEGAAITKYVRDEIEVWAEAAKATNFQPE